MGWESVNFLGLRIEERNARGSTKITKAILNECTSHQLEKVWVRTRIYFNKVENTLFLVIPLDNLTL